MATTLAEHPDRSWQQIATELSHGTNPDKITDLAQELNDALEKKEEKGRDNSSHALQR